MFAVPGWNLTAPLKAQTEDPVEKRGKKRKRKDNAKDVEKTLQKEDVERFWNGETEQRKESQQEPPTKNADEAESAPVTNGEATSNKKKRIRKKKPKESAGDAPTSVDALDDTSIQQPVKTTEVSAAPNGNSVVAVKPVNVAKLTPLQAAMHQKLASARFRHLNQTLYTTLSKESLDLFAQNPDMFNDYHTGFAQQVAVWPENPVDGFVSDVLVRGKIGLERYSKKERHGKKDKRTRDDERAKQAELESSGLRALPRDQRTGLCTMADLGCGTASFSSRLQSHTATPPKGLALKIHSFDLHAPSPLVTVADIANLPLAENSIDITVFCLALMGTNWVEFVDEAWRILRWKGECWISEIKSRFGRVGAEKTKVVGHSIGSLNKKKDKKGKKGKKGADEDEEDPTENKNGRPGYVNDEIDDPDSHAQRTEQTDITPFIEIMRKHGFALEGEADMSNKMFVKMLFVKAVKPVRGKNVRKEEAGARAPKIGKRFLADDEEDVDIHDEGKVLKPCVYKLR